MMRLTPRQLKQIRDKYPAQDETLILLAVLYLQRNLSEDELDNSLTRLLDETFAPAPSTSEVVKELKLVIQKFLTTILPTIRHIKLDAITNSEAVTLSTRLTANSAFALLTSENELAFPDNTALQGLDQLIDRALDEKNNSDPQLIIQILTNLFEKYPETEKISAFNDLLLQIALNNGENENNLVAYAKETLNLHKKIGASYLSDARAAFKQWKKNHKTHLGALRKITDQADRLAAKYPRAKKEILEFCFVMFHKMLADKDFLPVYFAKFSNIITTLIALDDRQIVYSLCFHLANEGDIFQPWTLIEIFDHPVFQQLLPSQRRVILNLIATSLNNNFPLDTLPLRLILDRCKNNDARIMLLQCLNGFYQKAPFPPLATIVDWIKPVADHDIQGLGSALSEGYITFYNTDKTAPDPTSAILERQLNKLRHDLEAYSHTSILHTRKDRAAYLNALSTKQLSYIDTKTHSEKQAMLQHTIAQLYLHYATIEEASGILSRTLEKRLIKLLQIPKDDHLKAAFAKRESFSYKLHNFFCAGRSFFKSYREKAKDPVHDIIWHHLNPAIKSQINNLRNEIHQLDQQDRLETTLFHSTSLPQEQLEEIGEKIAKRL